MWIERAVAFLQDYWEPLATLATLGIVLLAYWRARSVWRARDFLTRVNFSLNYLEGSQLKLRTLQEADIQQILLGNKHGKRMVLAAARRTTIEQPFLVLPETDAWLVLNSVLNELSEHFAEGFLAASMGVPTKSATYVFALTCEKHHDVRMNKIRVMIVEKSLLLGVDRLEGLQFERDSHHVRLQTLKTMRRLYLDQAQRHAVLEMELAVPASGA